MQGSATLPLHPAYYICAFGRGASDPLYMGRNGGERERGEIARDARTSLSVSPRTLSPPSAGAYFFVSPLSLSPPDTMARPGRAFAQGSLDLGPFFWLFFRIRSCLTCHRDSVHPSGH